MRGIPRMRAAARSEAYPRAAVTGVVLAGGRGARMGGADKGLVEVAGRPMVEHVLAAVEGQAGAVAINANRSADRYARYGCPVIPDRLDGFQGPLAGMASALRAAATDLVLFAPCDSPLVDPSLGPRLHAALAAREANVAVAHDGERLHPVFVLLRRSVLPGLEAFLARGERRIDRWFEEEKTEVVDFSDRPEMFLNVNREEDRSRLEARLAAGPEARPEAARPRGGPAPAGARSGPAGAADPRSARPPVLGFAGYSGSGKTTLATGVVRSLAAAGVRVAAVKHAHHSFDVDLPGKDSYELRRAGAVQTLIGSRRRWALVTEVGAAREPSLEELVDRLDWPSIDIVLVEGFKHAEAPKIAVRREEDAPLVDDPFVVAVAVPGAAPEAARKAGDARRDTRDGRDLPRLDLDRPEQVARFIVERFLTPAPTRNSTPTPAPPPTPTP